MAQSLMAMGSKDEGRLVDDEASSGSERLVENLGASARVNFKLTGPKIRTGSLQSRKKKRQGSHGSRRQKGGSRHKNKGYKPYSEKDGVFQLKQKTLVLQEKENAAAVARRDGESQFATFPVAPFNSTQFLMDEHCENLPVDINKSISLYSPEDVLLHSVPSTPVESGHDTITFEKKDREFTEFFTTAHAESLHTLPKAELVKHYINLEEKIAVLQKKVAENQQRQDGDLYSPVHRQLEKVSDSNCNSDANSLSSVNEHYIDLDTVKEPPVSVQDSTDAISNIKDSGDKLS